MMKIQPNNEKTAVVEQLSSALPPSPELRTTIDTKQFRVLGRLDKLNSFGVACTRLELGNVSGTATATLPHPHFPHYTRDVTHGDVVQVSGKLFRRYDKHFIWADRINPLPSNVSIQATALLPKEWVLPSFQADLRTVINAWNTIGHPALRQILSTTFLDSSTAMGFLNAPGSLNHHHAYQAGLLKHTAEMLTGLMTQPGYQRTGLSRDLAIVLIILHDIGKTVTLVGPKKVDNNHMRGAYQPHDMAALEILATPLAKLEVENAQLANIIRGYYKPKHWYPKSFSPAYNIVSMLDKQSAFYVKRPDLIGG